MAVRIAQKSARRLSYPPPRITRAPSLQPDSRHERDLAALEVEHATSGVSKGGTITKSPFPIYGAALLDSFFFRYEYRDHHLRRIQITPAYPSAGNIKIGFHDRNSDDDYYYDVIHRILYDPQIEKYSLSAGYGVSTWPEYIGDTKPSGDFVFALRGFEFAYHEDDNHVARIEIRESSDKLIVAFADQDPDRYIWSVQYAWVPRHLFSSLGASEGKHARGSTASRIPPGPSILRGFRLQFNSLVSFFDKDHHIKRLGVMTRNDGKLETYFGDKNGDDWYDWHVEWGVLKA